MTAGALSGVRVLDFSKFLPGPYCTWMLGDLGADIIRVEHPKELAKQAAVFGAAHLTLEQQKVRRERDIFARNKKSLLLDPGATESRAILLDLVGKTDVLVEDYRPGVMDGMGLGYAALAEINPMLVYASVTLCGQTGPYRDKPGHDPIALAIAGALSRMGEDAQAPSFAGLPVADLLTGSNAVIGILAALLARPRLGRGQHVDIAMSDSAMALIATTVSRNADLTHLPPRGRRRVDTGLWRCADGRFVCTTDMEPRFWGRFCEAMDRPQFAGLQFDAGRRQDIIADLADQFLTRSSAAWMAIFDAAGTQAMLVYEVAEALVAPHNLSRGMVQTFRAADGSEIKHIGSPIGLSETPATVRTLGAAPGEDQERTLRAWDA